MPFKSDDRPSDTKSVVLHRENDARLLAHLKTIKRESEFWRRAGYFYLDFMAWLAGQANAPQQGQPFVYYQAWLEEQHQVPAVDSPAIDPESLAAAVLPGVRSIIEAALTGLNISSAPVPQSVDILVDLADNFSPELVLE